MRLEVEAQLKIPDGLHQGVITGVEYRDDPYSYTDVVIEFPVGEDTATSKAGYATKLTDNTKLGKLLIRFGTELRVGMTVDPGKQLIGKKCQFQTITETTAKGEFAKIVGESVKPV